jgi:hypothetical protein
MSKNDPSGESACACLLVDLMTNPPTVEIPEDHYTGDAAGAILHYFINDDRDVHPVPDVTPDEAHILIYRLYRTGEIELDTRCAVSFTEPEEEEENGDPDDAADC